VPHVASEPRTASVSPGRNPPPRAGQTADREQGASFESLLNGEPTTTPDAKATATDNKSAKADGKGAEKSADKGVGQAEPTANPAVAIVGMDDAQTGETVVTAEKSAPADAPSQPTSDETVPSAVPTAEAANDEAELKALEQADAGEAAKPAGNGESAKKKDAKTEDTDTKSADTSDANVAAAPAATPPPDATVAVAPVAATPQAPDGAAPVDAPKAAAAAAQAVAMPQSGESKAAAKTTLKTAAKTSDVPAGDEPPAETAAAPLLKDNGVPQPNPESVKKPGPQPQGAPFAHVHATDKPAASPADAQPTAPKPDAGAPQSVTAPLQASAPPPAQAANAAQPPAPPAAAAVPVAGIAVEIAAKAFAGKNRFAIRLDPPELGRIEVRLDVDRDGRVTSHLVADRRDTLDLLQRDSATLQRALQDAGLKTSDNGLQFSLRDHSAQPQPDRPAPDTARIVVEDEALPIPTGAHAAQSYATARRGGVDIRI
jgi:flagellar hook-length control protein FliK